MITVLCCKFGNKYGREYVERLRNMVARHMYQDYEFVCLTDDKHPIDGVRSIILENQDYKKQWWHKVHMFDPNLPLSERILYLDLDVVIVDKLDKLTKGITSEFMGIRDFNRCFNPKWNCLNSSVLSWNFGDHSKIFDNFKRDPKAAQRMHGDQDWIWQVARPQITFWDERYIRSYKWEVRQRSELIVKNSKRIFKTVRHDVTAPKHCSVLVFHGEPNPEDVQDRLIVDNWY